MKSSNILILFVAGIALGFAAGWWLKPGSSVVPDDMPVADDGAVEIEDGGVLGLDSPKAREGRLVAELEAARAQAGALRVERDALKAELAAMDPEGAEDAGTASDGRKVPPPHFVLPGTGKALRGIDWETAGKSLQAMTPLIREITDALAQGSREKMHLQGRIQQLNAPLLSEAIKLSGRDGISGGGINGVFTHPAVQLNFIHATLLEAGVPLDENQEARLLSIGDRYLADEKARVARYDENTFELEKLIDESRLKEFFFRDVDSILTPEQVEALHPASIRGRIRADLFSAGLLWPMKVQPIEFQTRADLATSLTQGAMSRLGIPAEQTEIVQDLAIEWAASFTDAFLAYEPDELDKLGLLRVGRINTAAPHTLTFLRAIVDRIPLDDETKATIRGAAAAAVPQRTGG